LYFQIAHYFRDPFIDEAVSDALVDMRINFERAVRGGIIKATDRDTLIRTASGIYYPQRTYRRVLKDAKTNDEISGECFERLTSYLRTNSFSQKEEDARTVLARVVADLQRYG